MSYIPFSRKYSTFALVLSATFLPHIAFAQSAAEDESASRWGLGIGVTSMERAYTGAGYKTMPFPLLSYEGTYFRFAGNTADLKYDTPEKQWTFALRGRYSLGGGYKPDDAPVLRGMEERKDAFWAGAAVIWNTGIARVTAEALADASGNSKGLQGKLGVEHDFRFGGLTLTPHTAVQYLDKKFVSYYYGVTPAEVTAVRPGYTGRDTINFQAGLRAAYNFNPSNSLFVDVTATAFGKEIKNSPLVDKSIVPTFTAGYMYRF